MSGEGLTDAERVILTARFWGRQISTDASQLAALVAPAVERILADRRAAVEAERDEWRKATDDLNAMWLAMRTERDAALAALDRVKALANQWDITGDPDMRFRFVEQLRAAVEGGAA